MTGTDPELWRAMKQGEGAALAELLRRYHDDLFRYGLKLAQQDAEVVKDAIQQVFVDLWTRRERLSDVQHVKAYLLTTLRHALFQQYAHAQREQAGTQQLALDAGVAFSPEDLLIDATGEAERHRRLLYALNQLTPRQREAVFLRFYQNLSYDQIAAVMQIGTQPVYNLIHQALKGLRTYFSVLLALVGGW